MGLSFRVLELGDFLPPSQDCPSLRHLFSSYFAWEVISTPWGSSYLNSRLLYTISRIITIKIAIMIIVGVIK